MSDAPVRSSSPGYRGRGRPKKKPSGSSALLIFLMFGAAPIGIVIYYFTLSAERQQAILDKIPAGVGGRALVAGALIVALIILARVALPAFHGASGSLKSAMHWMQRQKTAVRILLFPFEFIVWLLWFMFQVLFGLDALAIIACALGALLATIRIFKPEFLESVLPQLGGLLGG